MKQLLKTTLFVLLLMVSIIPTTYAETALTDVPADHWAKAEIDYLTDQNIIGGYADGTFKPNNNVTRLQAVQMIIKSKDIPLTSLKQPTLVDVNPLSYGYGYIAKAVELGIIHGKTNQHGERYFDANGELTRAQMAKVLSLAYDLEGGSDFTFPDVPASHWAYPHVQNLIGNKITSGYADGRYGPNDAMTRTQFSVMMARILEDNFKVDGPTKPEPKPEPTPEPEKEPDTSTGGKTYPDGWTAPVLKSSLSSNAQTNYKTLVNELGFNSPGTSYSIPEYPHVIEVVNQGGQNVNINFYGWENTDLFPSSYRIPIITKELFKLYFGGDSSWVYQKFIDGTMAKSFKANGFNVSLVQDDIGTSLWLRK